MYLIDNHIDIVPLPGATSITTGLIASGLPTDKFQFLGFFPKTVKDKAVSVKLTEIKEMIKPLCKKSSINDDNVINLLNYYELINELKTIHG